MTSNSEPVRRFGEAEFLAVVAALLVGVAAFLSRAAINPDGVSYLDLAARLSAGDAGSFLQGYWSPLYPALIATATSFTGATPEAALTTAHVINGLAALGAILGAWHWGRQLVAPRFRHAAIAVIVVVSFGLPPVELVTPDVLLLALMVWLGAELLVHRGARWVRSGVLLGAVYLVKTSSWPWLLLAIPIRAWGAGPGAPRRDVWRSSLVSIGVMALWALPLSVKQGAPTFGSAGSLNACWYLEECDSETPDTHHGLHTAYRTAAVDSGAPVTWAEFGADTKWTYAPWSDPTAWATGVRSQSFITPTFTQLLYYWWRHVWIILRHWLLPLLAGILLPWLLLSWRRGIARDLWREARPALALALLGAVGVGQFILVHAEPRLIAPYAALGALALLHALTQVAPSKESRPRWIGEVGTSVGVVIAFWLACARLPLTAHEAAFSRAARAHLAASDSAVTARGYSQARIVIVGPAIPVLGAAYLSGAHIVAQVLPASADSLARLPAVTRHRTLVALFGDQAQVAWRSSANGDLTVEVIARDAPAPLVPGTPR